MITADQARDNTIPCWEGDNWEKLSQLIETESKSKNTSVTWGLELEPCQLERLKELGYDVEVDSYRGELSAYYIRW